MGFPRPAGHHLLRDFENLIAIGQGAQWGPGDLAGNCISFLE